MTEARISRPGTEDSPVFAETRTRGIGEMSLGHLDIKGGFS